jgi:hypothetical protein
MRLNRELTLTVEYRKNLLIPSKEKAQNLSIPSKGLVDNRPKTA